MRMADITNASSKLKATSPHGIGEGEEWRAEGDGLLLSQLNPFKE